ncbi:hypothetical protein [Methanobrevibacter sp.]
MNEITILIWITIFIIGLIAIILVKLHFKGEELEKDESSIIPQGTVDGILSFTKNNDPDNNIRQSYSQQTIDNTNYIDEMIIDEAPDYVVSEVENNNSANIEYESQNQILINYENEVKKFQEPMNEYQVEIMTQDNNQNEKTELKDLFTIDELIKESKRKDSEREKEAQQIKNNDDTELNELKESIRKRKENENAEEKLIEEILADEEIGKILNGEDSDESEEAKPADDISGAEETIQDIIDSTEQKEETIQDIIGDSESKEEITGDAESSEETVQDVLEVETPEEKSETPLVASQKDIDEAISTASQEIEEEKIESISESEDITDALLNSEQSAPEIKEPVLKSPTKITENEPSTESSTGFEPDNDLDYRKDLAKITNKIKGSSIFKEVKDRLSSEPGEEEVYPRDNFEENYIRNVNDYEEYDEYAPIINETHDEFGETYEPDYDEAIRQENTRRLFKNAKTPEPELAEPKSSPIKSTPSRENIKIQLNNNEVVLKKGDEIIFKHAGETYSSQVYAINGDEISVRYRRQNIKIKPEDVKKIY